MGIISWNKNKKLKHCNTEVTGAGGKTGTKQGQSKKIYFGVSSKGKHKVYPYECTKTSIGCKGEPPCSPGQLVKLELLISGKNPCKNKGISI
jgi:hypothetical protein